MGFSGVLGGFSVVLDPPKNHLIFPSFPLKGLRRPSKAFEGIEILVVVLVVLLVVLEVGLV